MSAKPSNFRKTDLKRGMEAVRAAGLKVGRIELAAGKITIIPQGDDDYLETAVNPWDEVINGH
jgi:hypothetical protein